MINLLPPDIKQSRLYAYRNVAISHAVLFLAGAVIVIGAMLGYGYAELNNTANTITESANQKQALIGDLENLQKEAQTLADTIKTASVLLKREVKFSELIQQIGGLMPPGASLKSLRLTGDQKTPLEITANLENIDQAPILQKNLLSSELFKAADILNVSRSATTNAAGQVVSEQPQTTILVTFKDAAAEQKEQAKAKLPESFKP